MDKFSIELIWTKIEIAVTAIGGWLGYFLGGMDGLLIALIIFMAIDYVTGFMLAVVTKTLSSSVGFKGICRKVLILLLVGLAHIVDIDVIGSGNALRSAVISFYLANEGVSLLENASQLGLPIPEKFKEVLTQIHKGSGNGDKADANDTDPGTNQKS